MFIFVIHHLIVTHVLQQRLRSPEEYRILGRNVGSKLVIYFLVIDTKSNQGKMYFFLTFPSCKVGNFQIIFIEN